MRRSSQSVLDAEERGGSAHARVSHPEPTQRRRSRKQAVTTERGGTAPTTRVASARQSPPVPRERPPAGGDSIPLAGVQHRPSRVATTTPPIAGHLGP